VVNLSSSTSILSMACFFLLILSFCFCPGSRVIRKAARGPVAHRKCLTVGAVSGAAHEGGIRLVSQPQQRPPPALPLGVVSAEQAGSKYLFYLAYSEAPGYKCCLDTNGRAVTF
jgi:hypothetical protein